MYLLYLVCHYLIVSLIYFKFYFNQIKLIILNLIYNLFIAIFHKKNLSCVIFGKFTIIKYNYYKNIFLNFNFFKILLRVL
jgi:hypothetical protein